ncbi:MAG TPA: DUF2779 domain-containing protein [Bacteroidales bacterium]|nr:DUF2779 domain-containing protein [Bacteroidales bacterium]
MKNPRYLTKSRFKLALDCETKLFYTNKKEYPDERIDDAFLEALAEGGFQVGELAKMYHPGGIEIPYGSYDDMVNETLRLLNQEKVIIYEATIKFQNLLIRVDVLVKDGNTIDLIEVKAKSFEGNDSFDLLGKNGALASGWKPYVYDVAFQKLVMTKAFPHFKIRSYLCLANKKSEATVEGLNQNFLLVKNNGRTGCVCKAGLTKADLGAEILINVDVDEILASIYNQNDFSPTRVRSFEEWVFYLADHYARDEKIKPIIAGKCKGCEFRCSAEEEKSGSKNGFKECWKESFRLADSDFDKPAMLDIWNFRRKDKMIAGGKIFMKDVTEDDLSDRPYSGNGMSPKERQWQQIQKAVNNDQAPEIDAAGLKAEMKTWKYPLHFIDFETTAVAIPFHKGMRPYEGVAFQYSHHIAYADGRIDHAGEYLNTKKGTFPNFEFVRHLKAELEQDEGTIFRYHNHENTYLNMIHRQLSDADIDEVKDKVELMEWIKTITHSTKSSAESWTGARDMVDLFQMVKRYYYDPRMGGSISLKAVLPAVLNSSNYLKNKYSQPIYGAVGGMKSLNFTDQIWIKMDDDGKAISPYKQLPPIYEAVDMEDIERLINGDHLADGGAAMTAYSRMQFTEMSDLESQEVQKALLKYCELDTLAMVMIWEYWKKEITALARN